MLALSTSWQSGGSTTAERMLEAFTHLGIKGVELSYQTTENQYQQLKRLLKPSGLKVVSIHNFFPIPPVKSVKKDSTGGGDLFLLSSQDDDERQRAIRYATKTIEHAAEMDAAAVVLHCGFVEMNHEMQALYQYVNSNQLDSKESLLQFYSDELIGVHLHDAIGLNDHIPPGSGEIDFKALTPFLKADTLKVIELKSGIPASEVSEGIKFIREKLSEA